MRWICFDKRGAALGDSVIMAVRLSVLLTAMAVVILGISSTVYSYDINVRDVEARILSRDLLYCVSNSGTFDPNSYFDDEIKYNILDYCGLQGDLSRIFVRLSFYDGSGKEVIVLQQGDSGAVWVHDMAVRAGENYDEYEPGYFKDNYDIRFIRGSVDEVDTKGRVNVEVLINAV